MVSKVVHGVPCQRVNVRGRRDFALKGDRDQVKGSYRRVSVEGYPLLLFGVLGRLVPMDLLLRGIEFAAKGRCGQ